MRLTIVLTLFGLAAAANTFLPVVLRDDQKSNQYIAFGDQFYTFDLPNLALLRTFTEEGATFSAPGSLRNNIVTLADKNKTGSYQVNTQTFTITYDANKAAPTVYYPSSGLEITDEQGFVYKYFGGTSISKLDSNYNVIGQVTLPKDYGVIIIFTVSNGTLSLAAATAGVNGDTHPDYDYFTIDTQSLSIIEGPVQLINSGANGCVYSNFRNCTSNHLIYISLVDGVVVWAYTKAQGETLQVYISSYNSYCGISNNTFDDNGLQPSATGNANCPSSINCGQLRRCGDLCYNPARSYCCPDGTSGFYYIDGQPNPAATCRAGVVATTSGSLPTTGNLPTTAQRTGATSIQIDTNAGGNSESNGSENGNTNGNGTGNTNDSGIGSTNGNETGTGSGNGTGTESGNGTGNNGSGTDNSTLGRNQFNSAAAVSTSVLLIFISAILL